VYSILPKCRSPERKIPGETIQYSHMEGQGHKNTLIQLLRSPLNNMTQILISVEDRVPPNKTSLHFKKELLITIAATIEELQATNLKNI